jgi:hypothetical protein
VAGRLLPRRPTPDPRRRCRPSVRRRRPTRRPTASG